MGISERLRRPVDAASLTAFRVGLGLLLLVAALRYFAHGWIAEYFLTPRHFFKYWGFAWVSPWPGVGMYLHFGLMALCAGCVVLGYRQRISVALYGLLFAYAHLIDKTNYLNHYYLVVCLCGLMACLPLGRGARVPTYALWALRAQFALVYVFGGLAKLNTDWLLRAHPLDLWLARSADLPVLGPWLAQPWLAPLMSWAGALFDLSVVPLLLWRCTRPFAYGVLVSFHLLTAALFSIGLFPYFMICGSLLFLPPDWPRKLLRRPSQDVSPQPPARGGGWLPVALSTYFALQLLLPLRHWLYPGDMLWTEQGFRFSWNVMLMEKDGSVDFRVVEPSTGRVLHASPRDYFTPYQTAMMAPQPDMVAEAARIVAADFQARGVVNPEVYVDAFASLNGRAMQRLIDPRVDLAHEPDNLGNKTWILPLQSEKRTPLASLARSFE